MKQLLLWALLLFAAWSGYAYFADRPEVAASLGVARADAG